MKKIILYSSDKKTIKHRDIKNCQSWKYTKNFNQEKHLFSNILETDYLIETYICQCGETISIVKDKNHNINFQCSKCKNKIFYDANLAYRNINFFLEKYKIPIETFYKVEIFNDKIKISLSTYIPNDINFLGEKVYFSFIDINFIELSFDGILKENYVSSINYKKVYKDLESLLLKTIIKNPQLLNIPLRKNISLNKILFFLKHKYIKDYDLYFWKDLEYFSKEKKLTIKKAFEIILDNTKEISVKKAVFKNYQKQMNEYGYYNPHLVILFIRKFQDPNFIVKFLELDIYNDSNIKKSAKFIINFLLYRFSQKQIYYLFEKLQNLGYDTIMFNDFIRAIKKVSNPIEFFKKYKKTKCNIKSLHNNLVKYIQKKEQIQLIQKKLNNNENRLKRCICIEEYFVKVPKNGEELLNWSKCLKNCMVVYFNFLEQNLTDIYCFFKNDKVDFAVEIQNNKLIQASKINNQELNLVQKRVLKIWLKKFMIENQI